MKVLIIDGNGAYRELFKSLGMEIVPNMEAAQLAVFTGGEDVTPRLYGDATHPTTYYSIYRDNKEQAKFAYFQANNIPMVGICRGGQFLNVMNGGRMYQDVTGHTRSHDLIDSQTGEIVHVTSTHHQMMMPSKEAEIVAVSDLPSDRVWMQDGVVARDSSNTGIEVVCYHKTRSLCFQPHPEMYMNDPFFDPMRQYFRKCLRMVLA